VGTKRARLLGHAGIEITQISLKDVLVWETRQGQVEFSPLESLDVGNLKREQWKQR